MIGFIVGYILLGLITVYIVAKAEVKSGIDYTLTDVIMTILAGALLGPLLSLVCLLEQGQKIVIFKGKK